MSKTLLHTRIIQYPFTAGLQGAQIESVREETRGQLHDLIMEYQAFERKNSELFERDGRIFERVSGRFVPMRIRFEAITGLEGDAYFKNPPAEAEARLLIDLLSWQASGRNDIFHLFSVKAIDAPDLVFYARRASHEQTPGESTPVSLERDWCPPPPMPNALHTPCQKPSIAGLVATRSQCGSMTALSAAACLLAESISSLKTTPRSILS